jgi:hypothetical protein
MPENIKNPKQDQRQRSPEQDDDTDRRQHDIGESTVGNPNQQDPNKQSDKGRPDDDLDLDLDDFEDEEDAVTR